MHKLRHWKYQVILVTPFLPWLLIHYVDWLYDLAKSLGWDELASAFVLSMILLVSGSGFLIGYIKLHEDDDKF